MKYIFNIIIICVMLIFSMLDAFAIDINKSVTNLSMSEIKNSDADMEFITDKYEDETIECYAVGEENIAIGLTNRINIYDLNGNFLYAIKYKISSSYFLEYESNDLYLYIHNTSECIKITGYQEPIFYYSVNDTKSNYDIILHKLNHVRNDITKDSVIYKVKGINSTNSGCSSYPHQSWLKDNSYEEIAEKRCVDIISALENKDVEAIKLMFSKEAINEANNLDENIELAINYYQGNMMSSDGTTPYEENLNGKEKKVTIKGDYTVITDKETYYLFFIEKSNTENSDEDGLYLFQLAKESEAKKVQGCLNAGIYVPK